MQQHAKHWPNVTLVYLGRGLRHASPGRRRREVVVIRFHFSSSTFQDSRLTSTFYVRTQNIGVIMSLIKKSDVKNHLSARFRKQVHLDQLASQPDSTGFSQDEPGAGKVRISDFAQDFQADHSHPDAALAPSEPLAGSIGSKAPAVSKSAKA